MIKLGLLLSILFAAVFAHPAQNLKIISGHEVNITERPYMVSILRAGEFSCGATLIKKDIVLTAAHCVTSQVDEFSVRVGSNLHAKDGEVIKVEKIKYHENWNPSINDNDLALVWLKANATNVNASTIPLASKDVVLQDYDSVNVTGWGTYNDQNLLSDVLRSATIMVVPSDNCKLAYNVQYSENMFCAGLHQYGESVGSCNNDAGGPVTQKNLLVGVSSYNLGCGRAEFPGAYLSIPAYRDWIKTHSNV